jgi:Ricin-type beta-trefoil lectin domain
LEVDIVSLHIKPILISIGLAFGLITPVQAQVSLSVSGGTEAIASYFQLGNCLDFNASGVAMHVACDGSARQRFVFASGNYGEIRNAGRCLTSGLVNGPLTLQACTNATNQRWGYQGDGALRNERGFCVDIEGGNRASGGRVVAWTCSGSLNQKWYPAQAKVSVRMTSIPSSMTSTSFSGPALVSSSGVSPYNIVAGGAGNIVAGGAGNIVAGGAGNIVAGGAGNIIAASIVAGGAGNLIANDGASMRSLSLIANDGASFRGLNAVGFRR